MVYGNSLQIHYQFIFLFAYSRAYIHIYKSRSINLLFFSFLLVWYLSVFSRILMQRDWFFRLEFPNLSESLKSLNPFGGGGTIRWIRREIRPRRRRRRSTNLCLFRLGRSSYITIDHGEKCSLETMDDVWMKFWMIFRNKPHYLMRDLVFWVLEYKFWSTLPSSSPCFGFQFHYFQKIESFFSPFFRILFYDYFYVLSAFFFMTFSFFLFCISFEGLQDKIHVIHIIYLLLFDLPGMLSKSEVDLSKYKFKKWVFSTKKLLKSPLHFSDWNNSS